jgi:hypothetical protein
MNARTVMDARLVSSAAGGPEHWTEVGVPAQALEEGNLAGKRAGQGLFCCVRCSVQPAVLPPGPIGPGGRWVE